MRRGMAGRAPDGLARLKSERIATLRKAVDAAARRAAPVGAPARARWGAADPVCMEPGDPLARWRAEAGLHEVRPETYFDGPSALVFAALWLTSLAETRDLVWVTIRGEKRLDFGHPCPDGLAARGLDPARIAHVCVSGATDGLWAMEEALKSGALVLGLVGAATGYDLLASRRLHGAAVSAGSSCLAVRAHDASGLSAALTRWRVAPVLSKAAPWRGAGGLQACGRLRWRAALERARSAPPADFDIEWSDEAFRSPEPAALVERSGAPLRAAG